MKNIIIREIIIILVCIFAPIIVLVILLRPLETAILYSAFLLLICNIERLPNEDLNNLCNDDSYDDGRRILKSIAKCEVLIFSICIIVSIIAQLIIKIPNIAMCYIGMLILFNLLGNSIFNLPVEVTMKLYNGNKGNNE